MRRSDPQQKRNAYGRIVTVYPWVDVEFSDEHAPPPAEDTAPETWVRTGRVIVSAYGRHGETVTDSDVTMMQREGGPMPAPRKVMTAQVEEVA